MMKIGGGGGWGWLGDQEIGLSESSIKNKYDNIQKQDDIKVWLAAEKIQFYSLHALWTKGQTNEQCKLKISFSPHTICKFRFFTEQYFSRFYLLQIKTFLHGKYL